MSDDERQLVDSALSTVEELLADLIQLEKHCEGLLVDQIGVVRNEIEGVHTARDVQSTYAAPASTSPALLDESRTL
jgi:hypothetical protein